jgi:glycine/D-amino acid oxidase-like deaminating enzyme
VESISESESGVELATNRGPVLKARWAVVAAGYESLNYLKSKPKVTMHNTFAFATESIPEFAGWPPNSILWESARPYFYARTTRDHRAMFGGADISFRSAEIRERLAARQTTKLERRWRELFPRIPLEIAVTWAGTFAETPDGLPYVGFPASQPRTFFALCYGGNGIIYSAIAGDMLMAALQGERHPCTEIFGFERK